jgi:hypothetical protein
MASPLELGFCGAFNDIAFVERAVQIQLHKFIIQ